MDHPERNGKGLFMAIYRWPAGWDPLQGLRTMHRELERFLGDGITSAARRIGGGSYPPVNVWNGPEEMVVQCEVPGVSRDEIELSITGETLVIKGTKKPPAEEAQARYQRRERGYGDFNRTIVLPDKVEAEQVEASLKAGILSVRLPKSEAARPRRIQVK